MMTSTDVHHTGPSDESVLATDYALIAESRHQNVPQVSKPNFSVGPSKLASNDNGIDIEDIPPIPDENTSLLANVPRIEEHPSSHNIWSEILILLQYTIPVLGAQLLEYSMVFVSVITVGHISSTALAASALASVLASVTAFSIIQGFTSALDTLLPSAWTSEHPNLVGLWSQRMVFTVSILMIPILTIWHNAESIFLLLKQDADVASLAATYLRYMSLGLPAYGFNTIARRYFQSQGLMMIPTRIMMVVCPLNVILNYLLVIGPKSIRLGFIGDPISSAISQNLIAITLIVTAVRQHRIAEKRAWHPLSRRSVMGLGVLIKLGVAGVGQTASEWWSWELVGLVASLLGAKKLAAQRVLLVSTTAAYQAPFALGVAVAVRIGNVLGERDARRAKTASTAALLLAVIFATFTSSVFLIFRNSWAHIFNNDPEVVRLVASILPLVALFQVFDGLASCSGGILRARGKQYIGGLLNMSAYYVIGIPFGVWLAFSRSMGLAGVWIGLTLSLVYCAAIGVSICVRTDWEKEVGKVAKRLDEAEGPGSVGKSHSSGGDV